MSCVLQSCTNQSIQYSQCSFLKQFVTLSLCEIRWVSVVSLVTQLITQRNHIRRYALCSLGAPVSTSELHHSDNVCDKVVGAVTCRSLANARDGGPGLMDHTLVSGTLQLFVRGFPTAPQVERVCALSSLFYRRRLLLAGLTSVPPVSSDKPFELHSQRNLFLCSPQLYDRWKLQASNDSSV